MGVQQDQLENEEIEIDIVDTTPEEDKGREPLPPVSDEELSQQRQEMDEYASKNTQKRFDQLTHRYHDERRAKEEAERRAEAAEQFAKQIYEENQKYQDTLTWGRNEYFNEVNARLDLAQQLAEQGYRKAYEEGNTDEIIKAQQAMQDITIKRAQLANVPPPVPRDDFKLPPREEPEYIAPPAQQEYQQPVEQTYDEPLQEEYEPDIKVQEWVDRNPWWQKDHEMTMAAIGVHKALYERGMDTESDEYYAALDKRLGELFPEKLGKPRRSSQVAPAGRTAATKKVTLTREQEAFAKKFNIPLERMAREQMKVMGNN
jgi:hypothetical protein